MATISSCRDAHSHSDHARLPKTTATTTALYSTTTTARLFHCNRLLNYNSILFHYNILFQAPLSKTTTLYSPFHYNILFHYNMLFHSPLIPKTTATTTPLYSTTTTGYSIGYSTITTFYFATIFYSRHRALKNYSIIFTVPLQHSIPLPHAIPFTATKNHGSLLHYTTTFHYLTTCKIFKIQSITDTKYYINIIYSITTTLYSSRSAL